MNRRTGVAFAISLSLAVLAGCSVPINKNDNTKPNVSILVEGPNGYEVETNEDRGNNSETPPINIRCSVDDPDGVRSIRLEVSDPTVDAISCGSGIHFIKSKVIGLPAAKDYSATSSEAPTFQAIDISIPGGFLFTPQPPNETSLCSPANNTHITVRCTGKNWSSDAAFYSDQKTLQINF